MLKFSKLNIMLFCFLSLLSVSVFANADLGEKMSFNETSSINLVELFKAKADAKEYINNLEERVSAVQSDEQEGLLVEFAQALLYYQKRHNSENNSKSVEGSNSKNIILNKALNAYKKASALALEKNRIKYTRELSELTVSLGKKMS